MSTIRVEWVLVDGDTLQLAGCERATEGEDGALTLTFADGAAGLGVLDQHLADGAELTGSMAVYDTPTGTEYYCSFVRRAGHDVLFQLVCVDD